jgi:hypothetical protein
MFIYRPIPILVEVRWKMELVKVVEAEGRLVKVLKRLEWAESDDGTLYVLKVTSQCFDDSVYLSSRITGLRIRIIQNNISHDFDIVVEDREIRVTINRVGDAVTWLGTLSVKPMYVWFANPEELADHLQEFGVKKTCKLILQTISAAVNDCFLTWVSYWANDD